MTFIKLSYKQVIDKNSPTTFAQDVFNDSYNEFIMQVQAYNPGNHLNTLAEVIAANPKANSLHYKVGFSIGLYINALNNQVPGLQDTLEQVNLSFESSSFKLLSSHIGDPHQHKVAITYTTRSLTLLGNYGQYLLLAQGELSKDALANGVETFMVKMQDGLSIIYYKESVEQLA